MTIYHKYLEPGHTHMECDSVHSTIETAKKHAKINLPTDYRNIIQSARRRPSRYGVRYLDYTFFKDYQSVNGVKSIKPSTNVGEPKVVDIHQVKYTADGLIFFNLGYNENDWKVLPQLINLSYVDPPQLLSNPIKISGAKWCD